MYTHDAVLRTHPTSLSPTGEQRLRELALGLFAAFLGVVFLVLLVADQVQVASGIF